MKLNLNAQHGGHPFFVVFVSCLIDIAATKMKLTRNKRAAHVFWGALCNFPF